MKPLKSIKYKNHDIKIFDNSYGTVLTYDWAPFYSEVYGTQYLKTKLSRPVLLASFHHCYTYGQALREAKKWIDGAKTINNLPRSKSRYLK